MSFHFGSWLRTGIRRWNLFKRPRGGPHPVPSRSRRRFRFVPLHPERLEYRIAPAVGVLTVGTFELDGNGLEAIEGWTDDSGEGRWTIQDATDHDVPTPAITSALYSRFRSRGNGEFADKVLPRLQAHKSMQVTAAAQEAQHAAAAG